MLRCSSMDQNPWYNSDLLFGMLDPVLFKRQVEQEMENNRDICKARGLGLSEDSKSVPLKKGLESELELGTFLPWESLQKKANFASNVGFGQHQVHALTQKICQVYDSELNKIKEDPERIKKQAGCYSRICWYAQAFFIILCYTEICQPLMGRLVTCWDWEMGTQEQQGFYTWNESKTNGTWMVKPSKQSWGHISELFRTIQRLKYKGVKGQI